MTQADLFATWTQTSPAHEIRARSFWRVAALAFAAFAALIAGKALLGIAHTTPLSHAVGYLALAGVGFYLSHRQTTRAEPLAVVLACSYGMLAGIAVMVTSTGLYLGGLLNPVETALIAATAAVALYVGFTRR